MSLVEIHNYPLLEIFNQSIKKIHLLINQWNSNTNRVSPYQIMKYTYVKLNPPGFVGNLGSDFSVNLKQIQIGRSDRLVVDPDFLPPGEKLEQLMLRSLHYSIS